VGFSLDGGPAVTRAILATATGTGSATPIAFTWTGIPPAPFVPSVTQVDDPALGRSTITLEAPVLADVQDVPAAPSVLGLWLHSGGYIRVRVTATDANGASDTEDVIVSFGIPTNGLSNVPVNVPVFLNGGSSQNDTWTWTIVSQPTPAASGDAIQNNVFLASNVKVTVPASLIFTTSDPVIWFLPKTEGIYQIIVERTLAAGAFASFIFEINAARYVADGLRGTIAPSPEAGQCGSCHGGSLSFLADRVTPYLGTLHAKEAREVFDPANPTTQNVGALTDLAPELVRGATGFFLPRASTGAGTPAYTASAGGFDDVAASFGVFHKGKGVDELTRRFPEAFRLADTQCESCHGPGSLHVGDSEAIAVSVGVDVCAKCHDHEPAQWAESTHKGVVASPSTRTACVRCHTARGGIDARHVSFKYPAAPPSITVPDEIDRRDTATCSTCHDPHDRKNPFQLRVHGDVTLPSLDVVRAGDAAICFQCHNSRKSQAVGFATRDEAHPACQGDVLAGVNGAQFDGFAYFQSPHQDPARFVRTDGTPGRYCITCHMADGPGPGDPRHDKVGEHTFRLRSETSGRVNDACTQCHGVGIQDRGRLAPLTYEEFLFTARADWDGSGANGTVQDEVAGLLRQLGGTASLSLANPFGVALSPLTAPSALLVRLAKKVNAGATGVTVSSGRIFIALGGTSRADIPATPDGDALYKAAYNYFFILDDGSYGIHNTGYSVGLLQSSVIAVRAALGDPAFTGTLYRP
jgi:hypothetical protein